MDARLLPLVDAFRRTADFLDSPEIAARVQEEADPERLLDLPGVLSALSLAWAARQLRAISILLESGFALESEPLVRSLLEMAINIAWMGKDTDRAEQLRDDGISSMRTWIGAMDEEIPGYFSAEARRKLDEWLAQGTGKEGRLPGFKDRAAQASPPGFNSGLTRRAYNVSYRRLSASVHADYRAYNLLMNPTDGLPILEAQDTAVAAAILIRSAGDCLGILSDVGPPTSELWRVADESQRRPRPRTF